MIQPHSLVFCHHCGSLLDPPLGTESSVNCFACSSKTDSTVFESIQVMSTLDIKSRNVLISEKKEDGATIKEKCPKCDAPEMVFHTAQLRSADEGQTVFYNCIKSTKLLLIHDGVSSESTDVRVLNIMQTKFAVLPCIHKSDDNPFKMPTDSEIFNIKDDQSKKVKPKNFKELLQDDPEDLEFYEKLKKKQLDKISNNRKVDRHFGKENLHDFIEKKREMFLVQYALGVKKEEMRKLEEIAQAEEQKLLDDEKALEEDAAKFDAFLKENDKNSVEAIKKAEMETKAKLEKMQDIKKLNMQIMGIKSDMSKNDDQLKDLLKYRQFLESLTPNEFWEETKRKRFADYKKNQVSNLNDDDNGNDKMEALDADEDLLLAAEDQVLYFSNPKQLLEIFAELEENNLALIQTCQETEETLEELRVKINDTNVKMDGETENLKQQICSLNFAIVKEEEKLQSLQEKSKGINTGLGSESQDQSLNELNQKVKDVYRKCLGDAEGNLSTLQMLTSIENKLEGLFEAIEMMPPDKVEQAEKIKDKERRQRIREEKMEAQRLLQEERVQKAMERAKAPVKKKVGKAVVFRSAPPQRKVKKTEDTDKKEEDDLEYYWT